MLLLAARFSWALVWSGASGSKIHLPSKNLAQGAAGFVEQFRLLLVRAFDDRSSWSGHDLWSTSFFSSAALIWNVPEWVLSTRRPILQNWFQLPGILIFNLVMSSLEFRFQDFHVNYVSVTSKTSKTTTSLSLIQRSGAKAPRSATRLRLVVI